MKYSKLKLKLVSFMLVLALCAGSTVSVFADETVLPAESLEEQTIATDTEDDSTAVPEEESASETEVSSEEETSETAAEDPEATTEEAEEPDAAEETAEVSAAEEDAAAETAEEEEIAVQETETVSAGESETEETEDDQNTENADADPVSDQEIIVTSAEENTAEETAESEKQDEEAADETDTVEGTEETEETAEEVSTGVLKLNVYPETGKYLVKIRKFSPASDVTGMKALVWSETDGQDDLKELTLSADESDETVWSAVSVIKDFTSYGKINVQVYLQKADGTEELFKEDSFTIHSPQVETISTAVNTKTGNFQIVAAGITSQFNIAKVEAVVTNTADESVTASYKAELSGTKYVVRGNISDLGYRTGTYKVRIYITPYNGITKFTGSSKFSYKASKGTITYRDKFAGKTGKEQRYYVLSLCGAIADYGIEKVEFLVWNKTNTTEKITYAAEKTSKGNYTVTVSIKDFKTKGLYAARAYVTNLNGERYAIRSAEVWTIDGEASGEIEVTTLYHDTGAFRIALEPEAPAGVKAVKFAVWFKSDMSDLVYYSGVKKDDGTFAAKIKVINHNYGLGNYKIKAIVTMYNGTKSRKISRQYSFVPTNFIYCTKPSDGNRTLYLSNESVDNVRFIVWSDDNGMDDMVTYDAVKSGVKWKASISLANHSGYGTYNVHAYSGDTYLTGLSFNVEGYEAKTGWYYESGYKFYYYMGVKQTDVRNLVSGPYQIWINRLMNTITIYALDGYNGYIIPVVAFVCSTGLPGMETPTGWYSAGYQSRWEELMGPSWGQYTTHVVDGIYIHSVAGYNMTSYNLDPYDYNNLGNFASHGCIRVNVASAKWIYDNCPPGTAIYIYDSEWPGPFGKPESIKIPYDQNWDPTDPNI